MDTGQKFRFAQKLFLEGKHKESISVFTESIEAGGKTEIALLSRGVAYLKTEQIEEAIKDFGTVLNMNSRNVRAHFYRGIAHMAGNNFEMAIKDFNRTIELKPGYGSAYFARGSAYVRLGKNYEAAKNIKTAIVLSEMNMQGYTDTFGMLAPQFDKAMEILADMEKSHIHFLTEEEIATVRKWLDKKHH